MSAEKQVAVRRRRDRAPSRPRGPSLQDAVEVDGRRIAVGRHRHMRPGAGRQRFGRCGEGVGEAAIEESHRSVVGAHVEVARRSPLELAHENRFARNVVQPHPRLNRERARRDRIARVDDAHRTRRILHDGISGSPQTCHGHQEQKCASPAHSPLEPVAA